MAKLMKGSVKPETHAFSNSMEHKPDENGIFLLPLPPEGDAKYLEVLVKNVISAFDVFQSDALALDYCAVIGKTRQRVIKHPWYKQRTKILKAKKYLQEIREIEDISKQLGKMNADEDDYDMRDPKSREGYDGDYKTLFAMKLKAAELRRTLYNMSKEESVEEAEQLQIMFVPITRQEWLELDTIEFNTGSAEGDFGSDEMIGGISVNGAVQKGKELVSMAIEEEASGGYIVNKDGSVADY